MAIQVLDRAVRILRLIAKAGPVSLTAISKELELPIPTAARILKSLQDNGVVHRADDRKYHLGARLLPLARRVDRFRDPLPIVHPVVRELSRATGEDAGFAVLQGNEAVVVDWSHGPGGPSTIEPFAREIPLHCAFGMVLLAFQTAVWRERFLKSARFPVAVASTMIDRDACAAKIEAVRKAGFYFSQEDNVEGAGSLSVPVFDPLSRVLGALFITGPLDRLRARNAAADRALLLSRAEQIRSELRPLARGRHQPASVGP